MTTQAYGAAKAGLIGLTHAQAVSLAHKVRVNAVLPGWTYTMPNPEELTNQDHDWHLSGELPRNSLDKTFFGAKHAGPTH